MVARKSFVLNTYWSKYSTKSLNIYSFLSKCKHLPPALSSGFPPAAVLTRWESVGSKHRWAISSRPFPR